MTKFKLKKRHRRNNKKQFIIITTFLLLFVFILGTAYSAFSTNLSINASGEVIQPEYVSIGGNNVEVVSSGDGLYIDEYESERYIYRGADPDNYIKLGNDLYRIIAKEVDGTYKVIKNESIGSMVFDPGYSTSIDDSILTTTASSVEGTRYSSDENDYCYQSSGTESGYYGCGIWGSSKTMLDSSGKNIATMPWLIGGDEKNLPDTEAYLNLYLNQTYYDSLNSSVQNIITTHYFNVGLVPYASLTIEEGLEQEQAYKWLGKVGLASTTDYVKASTNSYCTAIHTYGYYGGTVDCYANSNLHNWMYSNDNTYWLITRYSEGEDEGGRGVWTVYSTGALASISASTEDTFNYVVFPVFYLSSSITLQGEGTSTSPYQVMS